VLQQPAQPLLATNVAERNDWIVGLSLADAAAGPLTCLGQQLVSQSLMRPFSQVVGQIYGSDASEMLKSEEEKMVQTLPANRPYEPLDKCLAVRRMLGTSDHLDVLPLQGSIECRRKLPVPVVL
jgi:hypothetical protein